MLKLLRDGGVVILALLCSAKFQAVNPSYALGGGCTGASALQRCLNCNLAPTAYTSTVPEGQVASATAGTSVTMCTGQTDSKGNQCGSTTVTPPVSGC